MSDTTKTYYLRLPGDLSRELRHLALDSGRTMNTEILEAIQSHLSARKARATEPNQ